MEMKHQLRASQSAKKWKSAARSECQRFVESLSKTLIFKDNGFE